MNGRSRFLISDTVTRVNVFGMLEALPLPMNTTIPTLTNMLSILVDTLDGGSLHTLGERRYNRVTEIGTEIADTFGALTFCESLSGLDPFNAYRDPYFTGNHGLRIVASTVNDAHSSVGWRAQIDAVLAAL